MAFGFKKKITAGWAGSQEEPRQPGSAVRLIGNLLLLGVLWLVGVLFINLGGPKRYIGLAEGQRAPATVVASIDFDCVNVDGTELLQRQASERVVPVFSIQIGPLQAAWRIQEKLANRAISLRQNRTAPAGAASEGVLSELSGAESAIAADLTVAADLLGVALSGESLARLFSPGQELEALAILTDGLSTTWMKGILSESERQSGFQGLSEDLTIDIRTSKEGDTPIFQTVSLEDLPSKEMAISEYVQSVHPRLVALGVDVEEKTLAGLARVSLYPNLAYDERSTQERRMEIRRDIKPVIMTVRAGTTLMEDRTTVTAQTVEWITAYNQRMADLESPYDRRMKQVGDAILLLVALIVCMGWLHSIHPKAYAKTRHKWLLILLGASAMALEGLFHYLAFSLNWIPPWLVPFAIPLTLVTMLAVLMLGPAEALVIGLWSSLSAALIFDRNFEILLLGLGGSVMAVMLLRDVRKRSQVMRAGLMVGLLNVLMALALAAMNQQVARTYLLQIAAGISSGIFAAILATLFLPFMEWVFQHTTAISLLELTDMSHPLLQRLALEAPGTYHHSLMVAALGQAAANRIGANGLLVSVCANFHDIGKLAKPEFFAENQRGGENPHDNLAPSMSALVIQSHVKEGLTLAKRHKLPRPICVGIRTHHGTTLTSYFYQIARRTLKEAGMAEDSGLEHSYRYDGPRPKTREQAILMLADTVEAASRSLEKPTPNRISELVETLMREKLLDGQLDLCPLTLEDLTEIRASFVFSLTNILHGRNPYLREDSLTQPAAGAVSESGRIDPAHSGAGPAGVSD